MVKIEIINDNKYKFEFNEAVLSKKISKKIFEIEKLPYDFSFTINLVSKSKIKSINKKTRGIDKYTDVLSFPNIDFTKPSNFKNYVKSYYKKVKQTIKKEYEIIDLSIVDVQSKTIFLGDVVICFDILLKQAKEFGHSIKREYSFLLTHSLLHLLGYDHMIKSDEKKMFEKQDLILNELKITR